MLAMVEWGRYYQSRNLGFVDSKFCDDRILYENKSILSEAGRLDDVAPRVRAHVAILLAVRNGARFLPEQLGSYAAQTHSDWSLHVSDDGSDDNSFQILQDFTKRVPNSFSFRKGPCEGASANFLSLVRDDKIDAEFFAFSDQDDIWRPDKLEKAINFLSTASEEQPALYCSRTELINPRGRRIGFSKKFTKPPSFQNALVQSIAGGNTMVFNRRARDLVRKVGGRGSVIHDWTTYLIISSVGGTVIYDPRTSVQYRQHEDNLMGSNNKVTAQFRRLRMLLEGQWKQWNSANISALECLLLEMSSENRKTFENFIEMRKAKSLPRRVHYLWKSGVYRQTLVGQLGLLVAALFKKL